MFSYLPESGGILESKPGSVLFFGMSGPKSS